MFDHFIEYYDMIFPISENSLNFLQSYLKGSFKFLDVGCGTGLMAKKLSQDGATPFGFDLSEPMIEKAKEKGLPSQNFTVEAAESFRATSQTYRLIYSVGNTLSHLKKDQIDKFILEAYKSLEPGGHLVIQVLNYSYFLIDKKPFPEIKGDNFLFKRFYNHHCDNRVQFNTRLFNEKGRLLSEDKGYQYPLFYSDWVKLCQDSPFSQFNIYSSWLKDEYDPNKAPLIMDLYKAAFKK